MVFFYNFCFYLKFSTEKGELDIEDNNEGHFPPGFEVKIEVQVDKNHQSVKERPWEKISGLSETGMVVTQAERAGIIQNYGTIPGMGQKNLKIEVFPKVSKNSQVTQQNSYSKPPTQEHPFDNNQYQQIQEDPKEENLFDFDDFGGNSVNTGPPRPPSRDYPSSSSKNEPDLLGFGTSTQPSQSTTNQGNFDPFASWAEPPKSSTVKSQTKPPSTNNSMTADLLNFSNTNSFQANFSSNHTNQPSKPTTTTFDPFANLGSFAPTSSTSKPAPPSPTKPNSNSFDPFGTFNLPTNSNSTQNASKPVQKPSQNTSKPQTNSTQNPKPKKSGIDIDLGGFGFNNDFGNQGPKAIGEKFKKQQEENMGDPIKYKIWTWTEGKENNIRTLLSSLQEVQIAR